MRKVFHVICVALSLAHLFLDCSNWHYITSGVALYLFGRMYDDWW
jgi:hypothetical protein